jgi:hypothetical protein
MAGKGVTKRRKPDLAVRLAHRLASLLFSGEKRAARPGDPLPGKVMRVAPMLLDGPAARPLSFRVALIGSEIGVRIRRERLYGPSVWI